MEISKQTVEKVIIRFYAIVVFLVLLSYVDWTDIQYIIFLAIETSSLKMLSVALQKKIFSSSRVNVAFRKHPLTN